MVTFLLTINYAFQSYIMVSEKLEHPHKPVSVFSRILSLEDFVQIQEKKKKKKRENREIFFPRKIATLCTKGAPYLIKKPNVFSTFNI